MARDARSTREKQIEAEIAAFEALLSPDPDDVAAGKARPLGDTATIAARKAISELRREAGRHVLVRAANAEKDPLKRLRILRAGAEADGSWTAAASYAKHEGELEVQLVEAKARLEHAMFEHLGLAELYTELAAILPALPPTTRRELYEFFVSRLAEEP